MSAYEDTVQTVDLWKVYETGPIQYVALKGVNVNIRKGEFVSVVGPSGSGKTTLLNLVGTLDRPTRGEIFLSQKPTSKVKGEQLARLRNTMIGFVFQSYNLVSYLTTAENVELPLVALGVPPSRRREKAGVLLARLGLADKLEKRPSELSGGEQQRVAIARALANDPALILADEPTGNLDSKSAQTVASLLKDISENGGVTVMMVTHNMEITRYSQRTIYLRDGTIEKEVIQA